MKGPRLKLHHGGIVFVRARIYATVSGCEPNGSDEHFVHVYDATSLELIGVHDVRKHFTVCAGGITHRDGHFLSPNRFLTMTTRIASLSLTQRFGTLKLTRSISNPLSEFRIWITCRARISFRFISTVRNSTGSTGSSKTTR